MKLLLWALRSADSPFGKASAGTTPMSRARSLFRSRSADPDLWAEYAAGAVRSYRKRGVECALDLEALRDGADTIMFCAVVDDAGQVVGGLRAKALRSADDSHAVEEWAGQPGQQAVRQMIAERVPYGVLEMKAGWVTDAPVEIRS